MFHHVVPRALGMVLLCRVHRALLPFVLGVSCRRVGVIGQRSRRSVFVAETVAPIPDFMVAWPCAHLELERMRVSRLDGTFVW